MCCRFYGMHHWQDKTWCCLRMMQKKDWNICRSDVCVIWSLNQPSYWFLPLKGSVCFFSRFSDTPKSHKYDYTILIVSPLSPHKHCGVWFTLIWTISHYPKKMISIIIYHNYHHRCVYIYYILSYPMITSQLITPYPHSIPIPSPVN